MKISCIVHTYNSEATLERALKSLGWADEIIVVDMESQDATLSIAQRFANQVFSTPKVARVDSIRNHYLEKAVNEWIFVLDSDEYLADDAGETIRRLLADYGNQYDAFAIPRFDYIAGQVMQGSGWYPDHQIRLFRKRTVRWSDTTHVLPEVCTGSHRLMELKPPHCLHIHHENYRDLRHFIEKQVGYALNDRYDPDPGKFDFSDYIAAAYESMALRHDIEKDGDLSHALSLIMAWHALIQGLIHWDSLDPRPPLGYLAALPIATGRVPWMKVKIRKWLRRHYSLSHIVRRISERARGILRRQG